MSGRIETLQALIAQDPRNSRFRYMLANEYVNGGQLRQAVDEYRALTELDPDYVPGYFQAGRAAESLGELEEAKALYRAGIATARRTGDTHALAEIEAALDLLS